jgi:hypothetical protein
MVKRLLSIAGCVAVALAAAVAIGWQAPPDRAAATRATVSASSSVRADGRLRILASSDARRVTVRYRTRSGVLRNVRARLHDGKARVVLPRRATAVRVRALATRTLMRSRWVRPVPRTPASPLPTSSPADPPAAAGMLTAQDLTTVAGLRVYFGHQSVGGNILDAVPAVFDQFGVAPPDILTRPSSAGGFLAHGLVGSNGDPLGKIADFETDMRQGLAGQLDVALMKFCYVDVTAATDVQPIFQSYRDTLDRLSADHPRVRFLAVTVPLTTDSPADNARRTRLNELIRQAFAGRVFDLAAVESSAPDGSRVTGTHQGQVYERLYPDYSTDGGHLDARGAGRAATEMLRVIARTQG